MSNIFEQLNDEQFEFLNSGLESIVNDSRTWILSLQIMQVITSKRKYFSDFCYYETEQVGKKEWISVKKRRNGKIIVKIIQKSKNNKSKISFVLDNDEDIQILNVFDFVKKAG